MEQNLCVATEQDILWCQFDNWRRLFIDVGIKNQVISLPSSFISYILEDGIKLPRGISGEAIDNLSDDDEGYHEKASSDEADDQHSFPQFDQDVKAAIRQLGGKVFVKLNWSAPVDAAWINAGTMLCQSLKDVYLLLKASDRIIFDIERMFEECAPPPARRSPDTFTLVLKKWANLLPSMEFRVFVVDRRIRGHCA
jgi:hypothetical protein